MSTYVYNGRKYKVFPVQAFGKRYDVIVEKAEYRLGGLALRVLCIDKIDGFVEPFGTLTTNLGMELKEGFAFVKNYSENEPWAESLAAAIGGKKTPVVAQSGHVEIPLYDFSGLDTEVPPERRFD